VQRGPAKCAHFLLGSSRKSLIGQMLGGTYAGTGLSIAVVGIGGGQQQGNRAH